MAESTQEQPGYPGQRTKTLYAEKIRHRRSATKKVGPKRGRDPRSILLWASVVLALLLLLRLL